MIQIQERDKKILRLCFEQQFLMTEHVKAFFPQSTYRACRMRIQELVEAHYLQEDLNAVVGQKPVYRVTRLGSAVAREGGAPPVPQTRSLQLATLVHDAFVTSARQRLAEFWDAEFVCERMIKQGDYRQIPDGIFFFPSGNGIAIEVENSDKGRSRFVQLMGRWSDVPQIVFVLYVATSEPLRNSIRKWLAHGPQDQPMGVVLWDDLKTTAPKIWTPRGEVDLLARRTY